MHKSRRNSTCMASNQSTWQLTRCTRDSSHASNSSHSTNARHKWCTRCVCVWLTFHLFHRRRAVLVRWIPILNIAAIVIISWIHVEIEHIVKVILHVMVRAHAHRRQSAVVYMHLSVAHLSILRADLRAINMAAGQLSLAVFILPTEAKVRKTKLKYFADIFIFD